MLRIEKKDSVFQLKDLLLFSLQNYGTGKLAGALMGSVHQIYNILMALPQCHSDTSIPLYKCPINHSIASSMVLIFQWESQERYFWVVKRNQNITSTHFRDERSLLTLHIHCLTLQELNEKRLKLENHFMKLHNHQLVTEIEA